uniref:Serine/threonine-protein phosphatase 2A 55 kDa regulatory subunit B n=1 Tax=Oryctolagus cuniculus TaxID=9986 RepID=G1U0U7_RABIT
MNYPDESTYGNKVPTVFNDFIHLSVCWPSPILEADIISTVEFNHTGELLATGDKGGRVVIFQREQESKNQVHRRGEYNVYSTFQSHEPEFDYLKSLEIEEKINKIRWLPQQNAAYFLLSTNDKTVKLWKVSERDKRPEGYNLKDEEGRLRDPATITTLRVPVLRPMDLMVEATPRRVFANAHTYHINSISVNSDYETYMSADDLRINLWNFEITNQSFNIVDIKPANMEELTEVITAAEFHPHHCNTFVYSSSKGTIRLCDMRASALCDRHTKFFEEPEDPSNRSFFSEIISSISDVKFSHSGRYIMTRDYLTVKVWDLNMENRPIETYQVHDYLRSKLCSLYENDCIFDKFECVWNGSDRRHQAFTALLTSVAIPENGKRIAAPTTCCPTAANLTPPLQILLQFECSFSPRCHHDGLLQQLLQDVRPQHQA